MVAIDFSGARPSIAAMKAAGVTVVCRYLTRASGPKALTKAEADSYISAGLGILLNFEDAADNAKRGAAQGTSDAIFANGEAAAIGAPANAWIWYSCDTGATYDEVAPYYRAVKAAGMRPPAFYGPMAVGLRLKAEGVVRGVWVADAASWSGFGSWADLATAARHSGAEMLQHLDHPLAGIPAQAYDLDEILHPFPTWGGVSVPASSQEDSVVLIPRCAVAHPAFAGRAPFVTFNPASKTLTAYNGIDFDADTDSKIWKITRALGVVVATLQIATTGALDYAESPDGTSVVVTAAGDGGTFGIAYSAVRPSSAPTPPPAVDIAALSKQVAAHLKLTAS